VSADRSRTLDQLREAGALWPIVEANSCRLCAQPRESRYAQYDTCYRCHQLTERHGPVIDTLVPITYTAYDWPLGRGLRTLKDADACSPQSTWALGFGAILSAFLEAQLPAFGRGGRYDRIVPLPTSSPVIGRSLERAHAEGWFVPPLATAGATIASGSRRQRDRNPSQRVEVDPRKWVFAEGALDGVVDVLVLDDMLTTGASVFSFAAALRRHGVSFVDVVVVARNVGQRDARWLRPMLEGRTHGWEPWTPEIARRGTPSRRRPR
jgi:predicted amidophosphoribosyltransferase